MFTILHIYWKAIKETHRCIKIARNLHGILKYIPARPEPITEELTYPKCETVTGKWGRHAVLKTLNMSRLPIYKTTRIIKVTQIPCKPLEFIPEDKYRY